MGSYVGALFEDGRKEFAVLVNRRGFSLHTGRSPYSRKEKL